MYSFYEDDIIFGIIAFQTKYTITMYKLFTTIILSTVIIGSSTAQEKLIKRSGDTLAIKLIDINEKQVIYHKSILANERVFTTALSIFSTLIYADGTVLNLGPDHVVTVNNGVATSLKKSPFPILYLRNGFWGLNVHSKEKDYSASNLMNLYDEIGNIEAQQLFTKGREQNILGNIVGIPSSFLFGWQLGNTIYGKESNSTIYIASALGTIISLFITSSGTKKIKKSVVSYNDSVTKRLAVTENGIGLMLEF